MSFHFRNYDMISGFIFESPMFQPLYALSSVVCHSQKHLWNLNTTFDQSTEAVLIQSFFPFLGYRLKIVEYNRHLKKRLEFTTYETLSIKTSHSIFSKQRSHVQNMKIFVGQAFKRFVCGFMVSMPVTQTYPLSL